MKTLTVAALTAAALVAQRADAQVLHTLESPNAEPQGWFGCSVSGAGDVNNDGHDDVVVGAYHEDGGVEDAGKVHVFSGADGVLLHTFDSFYPAAEQYWYGFGWTVAGIGDVSGDEYDDLVVGSPVEDGAAPSSGRVYLFNGETGDTLRTLVSPQGYMGFGISVTSAGDVNGDGHDDVIVGSPADTVAGIGDAGKAYVFGGVDGQLLLSLQSPDFPAAMGFGWCVSGGGGSWGATGPASNRARRGCSEAVIPGSSPSSSPTSSSGSRWGARWRIASTWMWITTRPGSSAPPTT